MPYDKPAVCGLMAQQAIGNVPVPRDDDSGRPRFGRSALEDALEVWSEEWEKGSDGALPHEHASREQLRRMAESGGLVEAEPELIDHTSRCPRCLAEWSAMVRAKVGPGEPRHAPGLDYGLFEAAATRGAAHSRTLHTLTGSYVLALSPGVNDSSRGLVTLEVASVCAPDLEGRRVKVRARASGEVLLDGIVRRGYLAQRYEDPTTIDLSRGWTVVVDS